MTSLHRDLCRRVVASATLAFCVVGWAGDLDKLELRGLQERTEIALSRSIEHGGGVSVLAILDSELRSLERTDRHDYYAKYWKSYLLYRKAIEHMSSPDFDKGEPPLVEAIDMLKEIEPRDVEVVALLSLVAGLHLAYVPRHRIIVANREAMHYLAEALELDAGNARALYASAVTDFYTPKEYGGKGKTERLLKKALEGLPDDASGLTPRWGRRDAATLLVRHYVDEARVDDARGVLDQARLKWPNDPVLLQLENALDDFETTKEGSSGLTSP